MILAPSRCYIYRSGHDGGAQRHQKDAITFTCCLPSVVMYTVVVASEAWPNLRLDLDAPAARDRVRRVRVPQPVRARLGEPGCPLGIALGGKRRGSILQGPFERVVQRVRGSPGHACYGREVQLVVRLSPGSLPQLNPATTRLRRSASSAW